MDDIALEAGLRTAQQLGVLSATYPAWDVDLSRDEAGRVWWVAKLRRPITQAMQAGGVVERVRQGDAIALAATLAWQSSLIHNTRAYEFFNPPR
ncbi:hypothetical protein AB0C27_40440 [Nonomuraea sp. NPDC048882]|uniref:hypothetical protein n=1 Tax=Nonomuraea sp. NPDC048882 TaxID=3154347 RepID=UPI0033DFE9A1